MVIIPTTPITKKIRPKKITAAGDALSIVDQPALQKEIKTPLDILSNLIDKISELKSEFENLKKEIAQTIEVWNKEQKEHDSDVIKRNQQEELERKRDQETYRYETELARKRADDEFEDRKTQQEKELLERKEQIEKDRKELEELRGLVAGFEAEKDRVIKDAQVVLQKELTDKFETQRKLREQETKAEKDLLNLRITDLTRESSRQAAEIESLKKALEDASRQLKEIAVKVIESGSTPAKGASNSETASKI